MYGVKVTAHGRKRIKKRCGVNMRGADRLANIVFVKGLKRTDIEGRCRYYLDNLYYSYNGQTDNIRVYGDKIYIFCGNVLVTVFNLPSKYMGMVNVIMKEG